MFRPILATVVLATVFVASTAVAQPAWRLRGRVVTDAGDPVADAGVRLEALFGFGGDQYVGQRTYTARTNAKGDWSVMGLKAGIWIVDVLAKDRLPESIVLPVNIVTAMSTGTTGQQLPWMVIVKPLAPPDGDVGKVLQDAAEAARSNEPHKMNQILGGIADAAGGDALAAAGGVCLFARQFGLAHGFFERAVERDPGSYRARVGLASAAMAQRDFDLAAKSYFTAVDRTKDKDQQRALSAALADLTRIAAHR